MFRSDPAIKARHAAAARAMQATFRLILRRSQLRVGNRLEHTSVSSVETECPSRPSAMASS